MAIKILEYDKEVLEHVEDNEKELFSYSMNRYYIKGRSEIAPRILIVGTMTPTGNKGYYYTSLKRGKGNKGTYNIYSYLYKANKGAFDSDFIERIMDAETISFEDICRYDSDERIEILRNRNKELINDIENELKKHKVCFFDVFSCVKRKKYDIYSYKDTDIEYASLDCKSFKNIFRESLENLNNCKIIVDSEKALMYLLTIIGKCFPEYNGNIYCVPQLTMSFTRRVKAEKGLPEDTDLNKIWEDFLVKDFDRVNDNFKQFVIKDDYKNREWPYKIKQHNSD